MNMGRGAVCNLGSVASLIVIVGTIIWGARGVAPDPIDTPVQASYTQFVDLREAAVMGSESSPMAMIIFSDFQCPFCRNFAVNTLPLITDKYVNSGRLLVGFRHFPLESIHPEARRLAELAECARANKRFWQFHDALFTDPNPFQGDWLQRATANADLTSDALSSQCDAQESALRVRRDMGLAAVLDVRSTPTLVIGPVVGAGRMRVSRVLRGSYSAEIISRELESLPGSGKAR